MQSKGWTTFDEMQADRKVLKADYETMEKSRSDMTERMSYLQKLGDKRTALFLIMSDTDATFNFLISMIYMQLFNLLCEKADDVYDGRLSVHVRCLIDEMANIGQIPNLEKLMAKIRSREISAALVLQAKSQLKAIYKDNADTIIGNCDSQIFLGGSEQTTIKDLNTSLGKETIDMYNTGETRGISQSYKMNYQKLGHELPYLIVKSSDAHKTHRTGTRSSGRSSGQAAVFSRYSVCPKYLIGKGIIRHCRLTMHLIP